jgi:prephenate dehydrogenase
MAQLTQVRAMLAAGDGAALESVYANAQHARMTWIRAIEAAEKQHKEGGD